MPASMLACAACWSMDERMDFTTTWIPAWVSDPRDSGDIADYWAFIKAGTAPAGCKLRGN